MKFHQYDIVRVLDTGTIAIIKEISDSGGISIELLGKPQLVLGRGPVDFNAWHKPQDFELLGNVFEIICKASNHPFGNSDSFKFER